MSRLRKKIRQLLWHDFSGSSQTLKLTVIYSLPFIIIFSALIISLVLWETKKHRLEQTEELLEAARSFYKQIMVEKEWVEKSGGFFVKVDNADDGNTALKEGSYRKVDFATVLRGLSQTASEKEGYGFHIARLGVDNNYHSPDDWELSVLNEFHDNNDEIYAFTEINGVRYFRYMKPLFLNNGSQDSVQKSNRGRKQAIGITFTIPSSLSDKIHAAKVRRDVISYGLVGGVSIFFIVFLIWRFSRKISSVIDVEMEENRLRVAMELAGAAAHEMRQPLSVVIGLSGILEDKVNKGGDVKEALDIIKDQSFRIDDIIHKMLNITQYKTKDYVNGIRIFDLHDQKEESGLN